MAKEERRSVEILMDITPSEALDLLQKLASDDEFRDRLSKDPRSVLVDYRIEINDAGLPALADPPPKEDVQRLLDSIGELDEYGRASGPLAFGWFTIVIGFAMPLVPSDVRAADAVGSR
jgi:hypothetical protein